MCGVQLKSVFSAGMKDRASVAPIRTRGLHEADEGEAEGLARDDLARESGVVASRRSVPCARSVVSELDPPMSTVITTNMTITPGMLWLAPVGTGRPRPACSDLTVTFTGSCDRAIRRPISAGLAGSGAMVVSRVAAHRARSPIMRTWARCRRTSAARS